MRRPRPTARRHGLGREVALLALLWATYSLTRSLAAPAPEAAVERGTRLLHLEDHLGWDIERSMNLWLSDTPTLAVVACYLYATLHYLVTACLLARLWQVRPQAYAVARSTLLAATAAALIVYVSFPVAPPRLLPQADFVDTMARFHHWGWWSDAASAPRGFGAITNQFAALPSMHVGWAVWCALQARHLRTQWLARAAWSYPLLMAAVVITTANHYLVDLITGAALVLGTHTVVHRLALTHRSTTAGRWPSGARHLPRYALSRRSRHVRRARGRRGMVRASARLRRTEPAPDGRGLP